MPVHKHKNCFLSAVASLDLSFPRVCRQIYDEAGLESFLRNTFAFTDPNVLKLFAANISDAER